MGESYDLSAVIKRLHITRRPVTHLLEAIREGDVQACQHLIAKMDKRQINKLKHPKITRYKDCFVTPLLWAVMNRHYEITEALLSKGASADRLGYYEADNIVNKLSPLFRAIDHYDEKMIELLLRYGADVYLPVPGPRLIEEEGGSVRYNKYTYPVDYCFGKNLNVYKQVLSNADMSKEYGLARHTVFCSAVKQYLLGDCDMILFNNRKFIYLHLALQYGGMVCQGKQREGRCCLLGYCSNVYDLVLMLSSIVKSTPMDRQEIAIMCLINCLFLVFSSDYVHRQSPIHAFTRFLPHQISKDNVSELEKNYKIDQRFLDRLRWMLEMANTPSSLQVISRATIRKHLRSSTPSDCSMLPLPARLISYLSFQTTEEGFPYALSVDPCN